MINKGQYDQFVENTRRSTERICAGDDFSQKVMDCIASGRLLDDAPGTDSDVALMPAVKYSRKVHRWKLLVMGTTSIAAAMLLFGIFSVSRPVNISPQQSSEDPTITAQNIPVIPSEKRAEIYKKHVATTEMIASWKKSNGYEKD